MTGFETGVQTRKGSFEQRDPAIADGVKLGQTVEDPAGSVEFQCMKLEVCSVSSGSIPLQIKALKPLPLPTE